MRGRAFTLIELLIAFAVSTVLLAAIYFFYVGFVKTGEQTRRMAFLNMVVDNKLEKMTRDIRTAVRLVELKPRKIRFKRYKLPKGELSASDLDTKRLETVEYRMVEREGRNVLFRQLGLSEPVELFRVRTCGDELFRGYVLEERGEENGKKKTGKARKSEKKTFPRFRVFDPVGMASGNELERIPLVKLTFELGTGNDNIFVTTKVFMPIIYARLVEPDWNEE